MTSLIPMPAFVEETGNTFSLSASTTIIVESDDSQVHSTAAYLATMLAAATGKPLTVRRSGAVEHNSIVLTTAEVDHALGDEGYALTITPTRVTLAASKAAGIFNGVQTIGQLLPPAVERAAGQPKPVLLPTLTIRDTPRFAWRGLMLDVARHFFGVAEIKRLIDLMALYKLNVLHLHLTDDQGWRIMIKAWPQLALHGGSSAVGGGAGGYYTQADYSEIVAYAQNRFITIVPEIDMPGHTNAALASYAELNCSGEATALYSGTQVGFSTLCIDKEITFTFVNDVVAELAALTPGPFIHIGGDETAATSQQDYLKFVERTQAIVQAHGKRVLGWEEIAQAPLLPNAVVQHWHSDHAQLAVQQGAGVILSPASKIYLDMKYDDSTPLGLTWAGCIEVDEAYNWDPANIVAGVAPEQVLGVEAALWTETVVSMEDMGFLLLPRLPGLAELGWTPQSGRNWDEYKVRLAAHAERWRGLGLTYFPSRRVPWKAENSHE